MLKQVEQVEVAAPSARGADDVWPQPSTVWVRSKCQEPYEFCPCWDPCSPHEWPYNLQGLRGTEDYEDILRWYFERYQDFSREELEQLLHVLHRCIGDRPISVAIHDDLDFEARYLWFTVWNISSPEASKGMEAFRVLRLSMSSLARMFCKVGFSTRSNSFSDRLLPDGD